MPGPTPMALGGFVFRSLGFSFVTQGRQTETPWSEIETVARLDALQWTGPKSESFSIRGVIFDEAFGGQATLNGLRQAQLLGRPLMLVTYAGSVMGMHVVMSISEDRDRINATGQARINQYEIALRKYQGSGIAGLSSLVSIFT